MRRTNAKKISIASFIQRKIILCKNCRWPFLNVTFMLINETQVIVLVFEENFLKT